MFETLVGKRGMSGVFGDRLNTINFLDENS